MIYYVHPYLIWKVFMNLLSESQLQIPNLRLPSEFLDKHKDCWVINTLIHDTAVDN